VTCIVARESDPTKNPLSRLAGPKEGQLTPPRLSAFA
jgi:hypothetical protein